MTDVVIYGAGGLGRMVRDILAHSCDQRPIGFLDSRPADRGDEVDGLPVFGDADELPKLLRAGVRHVVVAVGDNYARARLAGELEQRGAVLASAIHPLAMVSPSAKLGRHLIIGARVSICVHAQIGDHAVISPGSIVEHDNVLGSATFLEPAVRLAGTVAIEDYARIGIGACVIPGRRVCRGARVEPGSVVIRDVPPDASAGGVPATIAPPGRSRFIPEKRPIPAAATATSAAAATA